MKTALLLALLCVSPPLLRAQDNWNYTEAISFKGTSQVYWIVLTDGRALRVQYPAPERFTEIEESWQPGRKLHIAYRPRAGLVLLDMATKNFLPIIEWQGEHPIDMIVAECLEQNSSSSTQDTTPGLQKCFATGTLYWQTEIDRAYQALLGSLDSEKKAAVEQAQAEWLLLRDAQVAALAALPSAASGDATASRIERASAIRDLHRDQAKWLFSLLAAS
ncbi:MAG: DUF1311 domain-containing protein [Acidobacteria bacterium]|nr:DUF1311 domain-containing protein [Acidobacteriota bacterium]